ncbi:cytochrome P450 [Caulobacter sp. AP07]|uniref:cytochrome P450 n=1 Tax=Caulobacter sp. AP07 TaxID=1144304 RepID=UPI000271EDE9|nr:cytochrome P450 [Caulobacter sp. AP07]EJL30817.1 cytochrome P450 [Caulobacter sp. AP07]
MAPTFTKDLFTAEALRDPFPLYREIRDLGPVVKLEDPDVYALARFEDVQRALRTPEILVSGRGVGFNDISNSRPPTIINSDGERHRRVRAPMAKQIMPAELKQHRAQLRECIAAQIALVRDGGWVDGVRAVAQHLPLTAISHMVGLPEAGRDNMLRWASAAFNVVGPRLDNLATDLAVMAEARQYMLDVDPADLGQGSWAAYLFEAAQAGKLSLEEARGALSGFIIPSLDTTIYAQGNLLYNLGAHRDQWDALKRNPDLIGNAVVESVRHSAVVRWFSRVAAKDYAVGEVIVPEGARVMLMYGSANRDERRYAEPDRFDVTRSATDQLGWGTGPHMCAGMHLAKMEMEVLLEVLVEQVDWIEVGAPTIGVSQGLYGYDALPLRLH